MTSLNHCESASTHDTMDLNNNLRRKSYSLRPRGSRVSEDTKSEEEPRKHRTRRKSKSTLLSRYRRKTANARERSRMREINEAFEALRRSIPQTTECGEKSTKISTLRLAMRYISALRDILEQDLESEESPLGHYTLFSSPEHPLTLQGDNPSSCSGTLSFTNPYTSSQVFNDCLLEDTPLFMDGFS